MGAFSTHDLLNEKYAATLLIAGDVAFRPPLTCQTKQPKTLQDTPFSPHLRDSHERVEWESWEGAHEDDGVAVERHDGGGGEDTRYSHVRHPQPVLTNPRRQYERLGIFVAQSGQGCGSRKDGDNKAEIAGVLPAVVKAGRHGLNHPRLHRISLRRPISPSHNPARVRRGQQL